MKSRKKGVFLAMMLSVAIIVVVAFMWTTGVPNAGAFPGAANAAGSCTSCHSFTTSTAGPEHAAHIGQGTTCAQCHTVSTATPPNTSACGACHPAVALAQFHSTVGVTTCVACHQAPTTETVCNDSIDNDNDGATDCADADCVANPACAPGVEICTDGIDNDNDGFFDCVDPDCAAYPGCLPTEFNCSDGVDNDMDGLVDCADSDCSGNPVCAPPSGPPADHTDIVKGIPASHTNKEDGVRHKPGEKYPYTNKCTVCHGADLRGTYFAPCCYKCHGKKWNEGGYGDHDGYDHDGYDYHDGYSGYR